jgi:hypothetical protein
MLGCGKWAKMLPSVILSRLLRSARDEFAKPTQQDSSFRQSEAFEQGDDQAAKLSLAKHADLAIAVD